MNNTTGIPQEVLRHVRRLEIRAGRLVNDIFAGQYNSTFKGRGMEFSEVREYLPGDDVRSIDWNVTARMGHPFIKKFIEERELTVMFLVDTSSSLNFGSRKQFKSELAAEITALLAFSALRNNDKAGMIMFSNEVKKYIPPRKTRGHVLRLIREVIATHSRGRETSLQSALDFLNHIQRRKAVVFILSDFLDSQYEQALKIAARRHDIIAIPISDPWEHRLPAGIQLLMEDGESDLFSLVNTKTYAFTRDYQKTNKQRKDNLASMFRRSGVDAIFAQTDTSYVESFLRFFAERAKRFR